MQAALDVIVDMGTVVLLTLAAGAVIVALDITAPEWITCLIAGSVAVSFSELADHLIIDPAIEKL
jgi:hypothetical protein